MKYILLAIAVISFAFSYKSDIKPLLCDKKWTMSYIYSGDTPVSVADKLAGKTISVYFGKNGEFKNEINTRKGKGTWKYDEETKSLTTVESGKTKTVLTIMKLTKDSLELQGPEKTTVGFVPVSDN
jgi:hypothetical protein